MESQKDAYQIVPTSVLEQLRTQDGQLFQDEEVLSLFIDLKSFVWTFVSSAIRTQSLEDTIVKYASMNSETSQEMLRNFVAIRPSAKEDFQSAVQKYHNLLRTNAIRVIVQESSVLNVIQGLFKRVLQHDFLKTSQKDDPIKLDFVFREAFRLALHHDCSVTLVVHNTETTNQRLDQIRAESSSASVREDDHSVVEDEIIENSKDDVAEDAEDFKNTEEEVAVIEDAVAAAVEQPAEIPDAAIEAEEEDEAIGPLPDSASVVSRAMSALSSLSQIRKPRVRTVIFDDDDRSSRFSRK